MKKERAPGTFRQTTTELQSSRRQNRGRPGSHRNTLPPGRRPGPGDSDAAPSARGFPGPQTPCPAPRQAAALTLSGRGQRDACRCCPAGHRGKAARASGSRSGKTPVLMCQAPEPALHTPALHREVAQPSPRVGREWRLCLSDLLRSQEQFRWKLGSRRRPLRLRALTETREPYPKGHQKRN